MNRYPFFKYVTGDSKVHLMNSKLKIVWFLITFLSVLLLRDFVSLSIVFIFLFVIASNTKISFNAYVLNILLVWPVNVLIGLITLLCTFSITTAVLVGIKAMLVIFLFLILTFTTSLSEIAWGFECLFGFLKKIKFPVSKVSLRIAMDIKFISTLFEQSREIRKSMAYRGVPYNKKGLGAFKKMIVPVISLSYKLSRRTVKAMRLRFYGSSKRRTNYHENKTTNYDKILIFLSVVVTYVVIWLGWC